MNPAVSSLVKTNHPLVNTSFSDDKFRTLYEVELLWSVFNALPDHAPRLDRTRAAAKRLWSRKRSHILPPRRAFETTVDYYEAILPLYRARERFILSFHTDNYFRCVQQALKTILPAKLF
jgi:hypothetical protein